MRESLSDGCNWRCYAYDANGNTVAEAQSRTFTWDFENRLIQAVVPGTNGGTTTFKYDPFGRRIQKSGPLGTTNFVYDADNVVEEVDQSGNALVRYSKDWMLTNSLQNCVLVQPLTICVPRRATATTQWGIGCPLWA